MSDTEKKNLSEENLEDVSGGSWGDIKNWVKNQIGSYTCARCGKEFPAQRSVEGTNRTHYCSECKSILIAEKQ